MFLNIIKRHLSRRPTQNSRGRDYPHFTPEINLEAYCLMPNHFHLMFYQIEAGALPGLMQTMITPYVRYCNKKYMRYGPLFQGVYKASLIFTESYFQHISRYIHLNPMNYQRYRWSSYLDYIGRRETDWLIHERITEVFNSPSEYQEFVRDYEAHKAILDQIKHELAD